MVRHAATGAGAEGVLAPAELPLRSRAGGIKAAAGKHYLAVEAWL